MISITRVVAFAVILIQSTATLPLRIGDIGKSWTDSEAAEVVKLVSPTGPAPWLLYGYYGTFTDGIEAYLPPDSATKEVRRGALVIFTRGNGTLTGMSKSWSAFQRLTYAQVAVAGRNLDQVEGDLDINRPFRIKGDIGDSELTGLVSFIRSEAGSLPIFSITIDNATSVTVQLYKAPGAGQSWRLDRRGTDWIVSSRSFYIA